MSAKYQNFPSWSTSTPEQKRLIANQLSSLDKDRGGVFTKPRRNITVGDAVAGTPDKMVLFISYGGTGADALYKLKTRLHEELTLADYTEKVRFLAIDSARTAQFIPGEDPNNINAKKRFESSEFLWLNNASAKHMLTDASVDAWINPTLKKTILTDPTKLDGSGASNTRQIGRVLMLANAGDLRSKVVSVIQGLVTGHHAQLDVYIITGISGGTGSGIVIDASYIIRDAVESAFPYPERRKINSMIMLPPTGTSTNASVVATGNKNGYAALKEIDHFLTINRRGEIYRQNFGPGFSVTSKEPIFDACFLFDGNLTDATLNNPRDRAIEAMCDSVIDIITTMTVKGATQATQPFDELMSDTSTRAENFVKQSPTSVAPRDANYIYCTLGYGKTIIPSDLMKAYVANDIYAFIYSYYRKYALVTDDDVETFLEDARLNISNFNQRDQAITIDQEIQKRFLAFSPNMKCGPYFVYALLDKTLGTLMLEKTEISNQLIVMHKKEKLAQIEFMAQYIASVKQNVYGVITDMLETMKSYLEAEGDSLLHPDFEPNSYKYYPIDFSVMDDKSIAVLKYLDNMYAPAAKAQVAVRFANALWAKRSDWSAAFNPNNTTYSTFNGANEIRAFWEEQVGEKVTADLENYLIKYYSKNANMKYSTIVDEHGQTVDTPDVAGYLNEATKTIAGQMFGVTGRAIPRLAMAKDLLKYYDGKTNSVTYFLVPQNFKNVKRYLADVQPNKVFESTSTDTISCLTLISGLPAFLAAWTRTAEFPYEDAVKTSGNGLHMTETKLGDNWVRFPNLLPENIWPEFAGHTNAREKAIADDTRKVFFDAKGLGLAKRRVYNGTEFDVYDLTILPETLRPSLSLFKAIEYEHEGTPEYANAKKALDDAAEKFADQLLGDKDSWDIVESKEAFGSVFEAKYPDKLNSVTFELPNTVLTYVTNAGEPVNTDWCAELAADLLRTWPDMTAATRGTVIVMDKLYEKVAKAQSSASALVRFTRLVSLGLINYSEEDMYWTYFGPSGEEILYEMDYGDELQQQLRYYFLFRKYFANPEKVDEATFEQLKEIANIHHLEKGAPRVAKARELAAMAAKIGEEIRTLGTRDNKNPLLTVKFKNNAKQLGLDVDEIVGFYEAMLAATTKPMTIDVE